MPYIADNICQHMSEGASLRSICRDTKMPDQVTVFRWLADERYTSFREQYAPARDARADAIFDEMLEIADTPQMGNRRKKVPAASPR
ncbi:terminase small subunit-like protein [Devosia sp. A369]